MHGVEYRVISIGTLSAHPLWDEKGEVRTGHATTTLISTGDAQIIVNPSLPPQMLAARMHERTDVRPDDVTHVFLTSMTPDHFRGLTLFDAAEWYAFETEGMAALAALRDQHERAEDAGDLDVAATIHSQMELVRRCRAAGDSLAAGVDLFPLPGVTRGLCGLLMPLPRQTVLVVGDAIATQEHLQQGKVLPHCADLAQAQESFREAIEIADVLIPGRDNITTNPLRQLA